MADRTLAHILLELHITEARCMAWSDRANAAVRGSPEESEYSDKAAECDDCVGNLRNEAKAAIKEATGVDWKFIESANL